MFARGAGRSSRRVVFYDLETSIVARQTTPSKIGRRNLIVEIGAVCNDGHTFHRMVDPRIEGLSLLDTFARTGQNADRTLRFWDKLFTEKMMLHRRTKSKSKLTLEQRARRIELVLDSDTFVTPRRALTKFMFFAYRGRLTPPLLVAHNGASFDHSIMRAHATRLQLPQFDKDCMKDSLQPARQMMPHLRSHSLGNLHKKLVKEPFQAHHALNDALALYRVCHALALRENVFVCDLWSTTRGSLTSLPGVGPKTAKALRAADYNLQTLKSAVEAHETCPEALKKHIRNHKSLWRKLRNQWVVSTPAADVTTARSKDPKRSARTPRRVEILSRRRRSKSV